MIWGCNDTYELKKTSFVYIGSAKAHLSCGGLDLSVLRMQKHIWVEEHLTWVEEGLFCVVWRCNVTYELKKASFEYIGSVMVYWVEVGLIWMLWEYEGAFELKRASFEWFEGWNVHFSSKTFIWIQKWQTWVDRWYKSLFENKYIHLSGFRIQRHIWEKKYLILVELR